MSLLPDCSRGATAVQASLPRVNQLGFRPEATKRFAIAVSDAETRALPFRVEDLSGKVVFSSEADPKTYDLTVAGEHVRCGDFSALTTPGRYRVRAGDGVSHPFLVDDQVYRPLVRDAARTFFIIRANAALDDPVTGLRFAAGHPTDAALNVDGVTRDLSGGWYNAGDYGKWVHMAAISSSEMMWLHELRPALSRSLALQVPQTYKGIPDLLQQARWGLEWMLRMQNSDGSVLNKVDPNDKFAWGLPPAEDRNERFANTGGTVDAGVFVGAMLQAQRVFRPFDPTFAASCGAAARKSWTWLEANPSVPGHDRNYADADMSQERLWALAAMAAAAGNEALTKRAVADAERIGTYPFMWPTPQLLGLMSLALYGPPDGRAAATQAIRAGAAIVGKSSDEDPYGYSARPEDYQWGSAELALNGANLCLFAHALTKDPKHLRTASRLMDYVLGANALGLALVTGHGTHRIMRPYHWTCRTTNIVMPGWTSGGPNGFGEGADPLLKAVIDRGTPPAKCHVDACEPDGSWASNEGQTSETASLVLAAGLLA